MIQRKMVRFVLGLDFRGHVDLKNLRDLNWMSIPDRVQYFKLMHLFRIRHKLAPKYLLPNFTRISDVHAHGTRSSSHNFHISRELALSPHGFAFTAIKQWNNLTNPIKSIEVFRVFKKKLKQHLISQHD